MTPTREMARQSPRRVPPGRDVLLQRRPVVQNRVRPLHHPLAIRREAVEPVSPFDNRHAEFLFELPDPAGQRRLRDVTRLRGAREVLFARKRDKILKLANVHGRTSLRAVLFQLIRAIDGNR